MAVLGKALGLFFMILGPAGCLIGNERPMTLLSVDLSIPPGDTVNTDDGSKETFGMVDLAHVGSMAMLGITGEDFEGVSRKLAGMPRDSFSALFTQQVPSGLSRSVEGLAYMLDLEPGDVGTRIGALLFIQSGPRLLDLPPNEKVDLKIKLHAVETGIVRGSIELVGTIPDMWAVSLVDKDAMVILPWVRVWPDNQDGEWKRFLFVLPDVPAGRPYYLRCLFVDKTYLDLEKDVFQVDENSRELDKVFQVY
ncbi:MAG: hypothetical protein GXP49_05030 [Deltaproteobacteria bacterium]|nr:hypothetical protein [Deltaproteobacteria bacterium]